MTGKFRASKREEWEAQVCLSEGLWLGRAEGEEIFLRPHYERRSCPAVSRGFFQNDRIRTPALGHASLGRESRSLLGKEADCDW